jgi:hypothetical protein
VAPAIPPDHSGHDIFLECSEAAEAEWLVTGNVRDFPPTWRGTMIATPRQFLYAIDPDGTELNFPS